MIQRILRMLFVRRKPVLKPGNEDLLLNYALALAQEWGEYWMQPIQGRLGKAYPQLTAEELDRLNAIAQAAMKHGYDLVYSMAAEQDKAVIESQWRAAFSSRYPWVDKKNLSHLFSTGRYYAWKG
jgi:hypothetical protein